MSSQFTFKMPDLVTVENYQDWESWAKNIAATWLKTLKVREFAATPVFRAV
jgi:hypothetical protein